jgi:hypothetical protein
MSRLVLIRIGDPNGIWSISKNAGLWASPECHEQVVRNMFMEGYTVYGLFVGTGDKLLLSAKITNVREHYDNDYSLIPNTNEIGRLKTVIVFDPSEIVDLRHTLTNGYQAVLDYVKYKQGSQILIPNLQSEPILRLVSSSISLSRINTIYRGNTTIINPEYLINLNINGC